MSLPQVVHDLKKEIDTLLSKLIEFGIVDDQNFSVARSVGNGKWEVTFDNAEHVSIALKNIDYETIYRELYDNRSYTARLIDGGLLQLQYTFENSELIKHRLLFLPSPSLLPFREADDEYSKDELFIDIVSRKIVPFPLRFDFDNEAAMDIKHPACHLTLGDVKNCRIPVTAPLTPRWFFEFVIRNFYNSETHDFIESFPVHNHFFDLTITENEKNLIHVSIPNRG